jgi:Bifunctional DNA primase/polymerase, N-terminal
VSPEQEAVLRAALGYLDQGWPVIPIRPTGKRKEPFTALLPRDPATRRRSWKLLSRTPPSPEQVASWFEVMPSINIAIATGMCSRVAVADFDYSPPAEVEALLRRLGGPLAKTGRGIHAYFSISMPTKSQKFVGDRVVFEIKADGTCVVAPPSLHENGRRYEWLVPPNGVPPSLSSFYDALAATGMTLMSAPPAPKLAAIVAFPAGTPLGTTGLSPGAEALLASRPADYADGADDWFREIARDEQLSFIQARRMGVFSAGLGVGVACPLHPETHPSAAMWRGDNGEFVFHDFHLQGSSFEFLTLPELRYSLTVGQPTKLKKTSMPFWRRLSMYETGLITPVHVELPDLLPGTHPDVVRVSDMFRMALGLHWLLEPGKEFAFAVRLAADLTGLDVPRAHAALQELLAVGVIQITGTYRGHRRPGLLYLPGDIR